MLVGYIYGGAVLPRVYGMAERLFPGRTPLNTLLKTGISCGILSTAGNYGNMLCRKLLSGTDTTSAVAEVNRDITTVISQDLKVAPSLVRTTRAKRRQIKTD